MAKASKNKDFTTDKSRLKSPKEASKNFYDIIKASVTVGLNTPKPKKVAKKNQ
jgi:hypothetical protein